MYVQSYRYIYESVIRLSTHGHEMVHGSVLHSIPSYTKTRRYCFWSSEKCSLCKLSGVGWVTSWQEVTHLLTHVLALCEIRMIDKNVVQ